MALSNSQYNAVMRGYEERQRLQRRAMEARTQEIYQKIPQIQELDRQISTRAADCARRVLGGDTKAREHLKEDLADLKEQKLTLLKAAGYPELNTLEDLLPALQKMQEAVPTSDSGKQTYAISLFKDWDGNLMSNAKPEASLY